MADGCYQDNYLPCSYKGIAFEALEVTSQHGRRGAEGEFPFGETTAYADLGRKIRTYSVHGRFMQNDHILLSAALIAAVEIPGPGILVHPTRGILMVACQQLRVTDNPTEGAGVTEFDMDFVEANDWANGLSLVGSILGLVLSPVIEAMSASFYENYKPDQVAFYDRSAVIDTSRDAVLSVSEAFANVTRDDNNIKVYRSQAGFENLVNDPVQLANPKTMFSALSDGMAVVDKYGTSEEKVEQFRMVINQATQSYRVGSTGIGSVEAVLTATRVLGAAYLARAALEQAPKDMGTAFAQYDMVMTVFREEQAITLAACDNKLYLKLSTFISEVQTALLDRAYNLPAIIEYQFPSSVSSLVAAHEIFGNGSRFLEIEQRNPSGWPWQVGPRVIAARN